MDPVSGGLAAKLVAAPSADLWCSMNETLLGTPEGEVIQRTTAVAAIVLAYNGGPALLFAFLEYLARAFLLFEVFILYLGLTEAREHSPVEDASSTAPPQPEAKWIIFGEVYDLTPWMSRHPGGALVLQQTVGTDCSAVFASSHTFNGGRLVSVLEKYWVRRARPEEMDVSSRFQWGSTPAHDEMRLRLREHFRGRSIKAPYWVLAWYAAWLSVLLYATRRWLLGGEASIALLLGVAIWYSSVDIVHCGMHFAIFESPRANLLLAYIFGMWSYLPSSWIRQHNILHHSHTNHEEDTDLHHFHYFDDLAAPWFQRHLGFYPFGGWRLSESTPVQNRYSRWLMMFPIYFFSSGIALSLLEPPLLYVTKRCLGSKQTFAFPTWELVVAWVQYAMVVSTIGFVTYSHGAFVALVPLFTFGLLFYFFTQVSHANEASNTTDSSPAGEWAVDQVQSTRGDYSYDNWILGAISGGLHLQSVHHVFPSVHWAHYPSIYHHVWSAAGEDRSPKTYVDVLREHFSFVSRLNNHKE